MTNMKKIISAVLLTLLIGMSGCKKGFLDINDSPNSVTPGSVTPDLILPRTLHVVAARMATSYGAFAGWMGYWARSGTYGPNTEQESYHITTTFQTGQWSGWYDVLNDLDILEKKANASGQTVYEAIAKTMKTFGFMYLVDQYNNVPYSKAFDLSNNLLPAYDKGSDIYAAMLAQLEEAAQLFKSGDVAANDKLTESDILFHGNITLWRKLVNTQRLKLLLRQSQVSGFNPSSDIAKILADGSGFLNSGETGYVQPGYVPDNNKQNPFWDTYEKLYTGSPADDFNRANNYVLGLYRGNNDIRYQYFFDKAIDPLNGNDYYGYNYGEVVNDPNQPKAANSSGVGGPALAKSASQPQWLFTSVESMFLQAEAIQRGWLTGDAHSAYDNAVRESFVWLGVTNAVNTANDYLAQGAPISDWSAATTSDAKIKLIVLQKYLALCGINNFEAWVDYRRLGVPATLPLSLSPSRAGFVIPYRLQYPQAEYNFNNDNVSAEGNIDPQSSKIFWDQ